MEKMKIEIWSDIACPHCYIGKRKLEMALEKFEHRDKVEISWRSYELDPSYPAKWDGKPFIQQFTKKMGMTEERARTVFAQVTALAREVGLEYDFENMIGANTHNALRLVKLASRMGKANEMEELLFDAYFVKGKNVSDRSFLIETGVKIGLSEADIVKMLDGDQYNTAIKMDMQYSENTLNLQYIPFYLFNNKQKIEGSIGIDDYLKILNECYSDWEKNGVGNIGNDEAVSGMSCSIDGVCS